MKTSTSTNQMKTGEWKKKEDETRFREDFFLYLRMCTDVRKISKYLIFAMNKILLAVRLIVKWELVATESTEMLYEKKNRTNNHKSTLNL